MVRCAHVARRVKEETGKRSLRACAASTAHRSIASAELLRLPYSDLSPSQQDDG